MDAAKQRQIEINRALSALPSDEQGPALLRTQNLRYERRQLDETMKGLSARAVVPRQHGYAQFKLADDAWRALERDGHSAASRRPPDPPYVFSIELISAGSGESILIHYGPPDATRLVMVNGSTGPTFPYSVGKRLQSLRTTHRFADASVPVELFIASDQDEHKTGGLLRMLRQQAEAVKPEDRVVELRTVWANIFASFGFRGEIRGLLEKLKIPLNAPFDHLVMRPDRGQLTHKLAEDLEIVILGPQQTQLKQLYELTRESDQQQDNTRAPLAGVIASFPEERFSRMQVSEGGNRLPQTPPSSRTVAVPRARMHENGPTS
jgi:hypothetical protein